MQSWTEIPTLPNGFITDEREYQVCKAWLAAADEETIRHPLDNPDLEIQRRRMHELVAEYKENWRHTGL